MEKLLSAPLFLVLFGIMFLFVGIQRLSKVATEQRKGEAVVWGTIGLVLAALFFGLAAWFLTGDAQETERQQREIQDRSRLQP